MNLSVFVEQFACLGRYLNLFATGEKELFISLAGEPVYDSLTYAVEQSCKHNMWFSEDSVKTAIQSIADTMLTRDALTQWIARYPELTYPREVKTVGVIMAGNIPLVGFHDFLCVLLSGNRAQIKLSSKDAYLLPAVIQVLTTINPQFEQMVQFVPKELAGIDALIATGSNNSARYFESTYQTVPRIIRKNRSSVAVLSGNETTQELEKLAFDILSYFGLGCRNVSKIYVPTGYNFTPLLSSFSTQKSVLNNRHYANCLNYARALLAMQKSNNLSNEYIVLQESSSLYPSVGVVHYEFYSNLALQISLLNKLTGELQCIVANPATVDGVVNFGQTQQPQLWDYADRVDTLHFLLTM